jgi:hypothetical protein
MTENDVETDRNTVRAVDDEVSFDEDAGTATITLDGFDQISSAEVAAYFAAVRAVNEDARDVEVEARKLHSALLAVKDGVVDEVKIKVV